MDSIFRTFFNAVHTGYAAAVIDLMFFDVNASCFAVALTEVTVYAFVSIDNRLQPGIAGEKSQYGSNRADCIAVGTSILPGQNDQCDESNSSNSECREAFHPYIYRIESIAVGTFSEIGQQVVSPLI